MATRTYSPADISITFGPHIVTGTADGTFLTIEEITDGIVSQAGADGEVARAMSADTRVRATLTLQQTSASNTFLSGAYRADQVSGGRLPLPLVIRDLRGDTVFAAPASWVVKMANSEFSKEVSSREWVIETGQAEYIAGGNEGA